MRFFFWIYALAPLFSSLIMEKIKEANEAKKAAANAGNSTSICPLGEQSGECLLQANKFALGIGGRLFNPRPGMERGSFCYKPKGQVLEVEATTACCGSVSSGLQDGLCVGLRTNVEGCKQFHRCCRLKHGSDNNDYDKCI